MRAIAFAILAHANLIGMVHNARVGGKLSASSIGAQLILVSVTLICIIGGW